MTADNTTAPERIWACVEPDWEDGDGNSIVGGKFEDRDLTGRGVPYVRADLCASGQVRARIEALIEDAMCDATVDYPAGSEAGPRIKWDSDALLDDILAVLTPAPQPEGQVMDNMALVKARKDGIRAALSILRDGWAEDRDQKEIEDTILTAIANREAPQPDAVHCGCGDKACLACFPAATPTAQEAVPVAAGRPCQHVMCDHDECFVRPDPVAHPPQPSVSVAELVGWWERQLPVVQNYPAPLFAEKIKQTVAALRALKGEA